MIDVVTFHKGVRHDEAEAATPEAAVVAAQTLLNDYLSIGGLRRRSFSVGFFVDGKLVRMLGAADVQPLTEAEVAAYVAARNEREAHRG